MTQSPTGRLPSPLPDPHEYKFWKSAGGSTISFLDSESADFTELEWRALGVGLMTESPPCQMLAPGWPRTRGKLMSLIVSPRHAGKSWFLENLRRAEDEYCREQLRVKNCGVKTAVAALIATYSKS